MRIQTGAALLEGCVLAVLEKGDAYGYVLTQQLRGGLDLSESTLYPVLRRLQGDGLLEVYDQSYQGRNRRYYRITAAGKAFLDELRQEWRLYCRAVDDILAGEREDG
ncbi:MAG: PadR family transcriptional regulator [Eubacteriales bacterium]|nr:PadR family transcriptional regulator [Eubacteriales bacterium]